MSKKKKSFKKIFGLLLFIALILYILGTILFVCVFPKMYLSHKYNTKMSDYKVADYFPGYFAYDISYWDVVWHESQLVYEAKDDGRKFEIEFLNFQYYDAYQMKEVEQWLIEELQETVDENIDFVNIYSHSVYGIYDEEKQEYKNIVWTKENVSEIIESERIGGIFIKADNFEEYLINPNVTEITAYYNYGNTNSTFDEYINGLNEKIHQSYHNCDISIYIHKKELPLYEGYQTYGIELNELTDEEESYIILYN